MIIVIAENLQWFLSHTAYQKLQGVHWSGCIMQLCEKRESSYKIIIIVSFCFHLWLAESLAILFYMSFAKIVLQTQENDQ